MKATTVACIALVAVACVLVTPAQAVRVTIPNRQNKFADAQKVFSQGQPATQKKLSFNESVKPKNHSDKAANDLVAQSKREHANITQQRARTETLRTNTEKKVGMQ